MIHSKESPVTGCPTTTRTTKTRTVEMMTKEVITAITAGTQITTMHVEPGETATPTALVTTVEKEATCRETVRSLTSSLSEHMTQQLANPNQGQLAHH